MEQYRTAFRTLLNTIILKQPIEEKLPRKTVSEVSVLIQKEYMDGYLNEQVNVKKNLHEMISSLMIVPDPDGEEENTISLAEAIDFEKVKIRNYSAGDDLDGNAIPISDESFLNVIAAEFYVKPSYYQATGFTPKLSIDKNRLGFQQTNCFGQSIVFGARCKDRGLHIELGISPDHPHVIVYLDSGTYIFDEKRNVCKMGGLFTQYNGYKTYLPLPEDAIESGMLLVVPFNEGILYEILENVEVLRHAMLGSKKDFLPGTQAEVVKTAMDHRSVLKIANWKAVQEYFFPDIVKAIADHQKDFDQEIKSVAIQRHNNTRELAVQYCLRYSFEEKDITFLKSNDDILSIFRCDSYEYLDLLMLFLWRATPFPDTVPANLVRRFLRLKENIQEKAEHQEQGFQEFAYKMVYKFLRSHTK